MTQPSLITIQTTISAPIEKVWSYFNEPEHITQWAFASDDWEAPYAENDLRVGGKFKTVMAAKDKSFKFDFNGVYSNVKKHEVIEYNIEDGRYVKVLFEQAPDGVQVTEMFEPETENSETMQRNGWQAILDNFKKHAESQA